MQLIFDGHNDVLSKLSNLGGVETADLFLSGLPGHLDLTKARAGGFGGGFFALWGRSSGGMNLDGLEAEYDIPLPPTLLQPTAWDMAAQQAAILHRLQDLGALRICTSVVQIEQARSDAVLAAILHLEGAEAISPDLAELDDLVALGLRSLGPVWSRANIFGTGVPFRYPSDGDIGGGLTEVGRALVARCGDLGVLVDLSHLNVAGFWDVAEISDKPLVATHSNAHAVAPHARNLTDAQLRAMAGSGGVAGLNFESSFLRPDGRRNPELPVSVMLAHLDHMLNLLGEDGVVIGSDFDGCRPPDWLIGADKLPVLVQAMEAHGYAADRIERICWSNWMRVLRDTWGD